MTVIIGIASLIIFGGAALVFGKRESAPQEKLDIIEDFKAIKRAMLSFKKDNINKLDNVLQLERHLEEGYRIDWKRYSLSPDEKYLVVNRIGDIDCQSLIELVGGASRKEGDKLYLSFLKFKVSVVEPKAVITMHPDSGITTTTPVTWNHEQSQVEGGEIREVQWENKKDLYGETGPQKVSLRVMDRNEVWSEWVSVEFEVTEVRGIKAIEAGGDFLMTVYNSGKVAAIGDNRFGQLGNGTQSPLSAMTVVPNFENIDQISCGESYVLGKDHQGKICGAGNNDFGQLGLGNRMNVRTPQKLWGLERVKQLAAGKDFSAAVLLTGAVLTWGNNTNGQLGEEAPSYQEIPRRVKNLSNVRSVALGHNHMVCVQYDGSVVAWGDNSRGQVGSGFKGKMIEPTTINVKGIKQVAAGKDFTLALTESGKVFGWGSNLYGQLGIIGELETLFPTEILKLKNITKIAAKGQFALALTDIGEVFTWGRYNMNEDEYHPTPVAIDGIKYVKEIAASYTQAYILTEKDEILTWGSHIDIRVPVDEYAGLHYTQDETNKTG